MLCRKFLQRWLAIMIRPMYKALALLEPWVFKPDPVIFNLHSS
jgi:hypothetical protein